MCSVESKPLSAAVMHRLAKELRDLARKPEEGIRVHTFSSSAHATACPLRLAPLCLCRRPGTHASDGASAHILFDVFLSGCEPFQVAQASSPGFELSCKQRPHAQLTRRPRGVRAQVIVNDEDMADIQAEFTGPGQHLH